MFGGKTKYLANQKEESYSCALQARRIGKGIK
jgi:hypothetical protein